MAWLIEITGDAEADLAKLDKPIKERIDKFLIRLAKRADPRSIGDPLTGNWAGRWRYRVGDYRVICAIRDNVLVIEVVKVGHRREIYRHRK